MDWGERVGSGHTADIFALGEDRVLKRFRPGTDPATVRREAASARAAAAAGLPVPAVREVTEAAGRPAIVYERVRGPTMRSRLARRPWAVRRYARLLAALHASIHAARPAGVPSLRDRLSRNVEAAPGLSAAARRRARSMLASLPRGRALCHGDFHPENVLLAERGPVVVDWLDAARGPPAADVARTALLLRYAGGEAGPLGAAVRRAFRWWYLRAYCARRAVSRWLIRAWEVPVAAARLTEGVPEAHRLRAFVEARVGEG
jgi:aminoglycoside phosphotransferase (APT) family kinase protein